MKTLITITLLISTLSANCQTIAKGKIKSNENFQVQILHIEQNKRNWIDWPMWEYNEFYDVKAEKFDQIRARFITCSDTTNLIVNGQIDRTKKKRDIQLNGQTYIIGEHPYLD